LARKKIGKERSCATWLLRRASNILLIPGTSSVKHLRENLQAAALELSQETIAKLDSIAVGA
jgi:aryl-alcohol dehydrogenase-like predicted oxidoreductase